MAPTGRDARPDPEDVFALNKAKSPLAGMGTGQKIASAALLLLALIALIAFAAGRGGGGTSGAEPSSGFTRASYGTSGPGSTNEASGTSSTTHRGGSARSDAVVSVGELPAQARDTIELIDAGGPYPYSRDGIVFGNFEHQLPAQAKGWYHEYTVKTPGASSRGTRRIIVGKDGTMYYTDDHYRTFRRVER